MPIIMKEDRFSQEFCFNSFMKAAQYFSGMPVNADIYEEAARVITRFFKTDLAFFTVRGADGTLNISHICFGNKEFFPSQTGLSEQEIISQSGEFVEQVLETEFMAFENIELKEDTYAVIFLPIVQSNQAVSVLAISYNDKRSVSKEMLNVYLGVAGLVSSMLEKQVSQHRFQVMAENVPEVLYRLMVYPDRTATFDYVSKGSTNTLGLSPDVFMYDASGFFNNIGADDRLAFYRNAFKSLKKKSRLSMSFRWNDDSGNIRYILINAMPTLAEDGTCVWDGAAQDITEIKTAELEIKKLNEELEQRVEERTAKLAEAYDEIHKLNEQLKDDNLRMHSEMEVARRIQTSLLPPLVKEMHPDFHIAATMMPAEEVGGDYYDIMFDQVGNLWFGIGDVSGHGVTPGLIMMIAQTAHTTITENYHASPREVITMVNKVLYKNVHDRLGDNNFMTFTTMKYLGDGRFQYAGAHLDLVVYRKEQKICEHIETPGAWLNFLPDISEDTENSEFILDIGDVLVLYTDGLTEVWDNEKNMLDIPGFMDIVQTHAEKDVESLRDAIITDVMAWCNHIRNDDMSLVVVRRRR